jgi:hypothetical protein
VDAMVIHSRRIRKIIRDCEVSPAGGSISLKWVHLLVFAWNRIRMCRPRNRHGLYNKNIHNPFFLLLSEMMRIGFF